MADDDRQHPLAEAERCDEAAGQDLGDGDRRSEPHEPYSQHTERTRTVLSHSSSPRGEAVSVGMRIHLCSCRITGTVFSVVAWRHLSADRLPMVMFSRW